MTPTTFGHYRIDSQIGKGGMAEVFRAFDTRLQRPVAVKVMRADATLSAAAVNRFLREARAASALNHPNIVIIHEVGETADGEPFIVQELIDGRTLRAVLQEELPLAAAFDLGIQIARALHAAHKAGIVHRDVKPENIMVRTDGLVKMLDFGLARHVEVDDVELATRTNLDTAPGSLMGTPSYMPPEQASAHVSGPAADIFSFGVVLYEMAAGRRPFVASTHIGVIASILADHPMPLTRVNASIPRAFDELVLRMLEKSPDRRPAAGEVERELAALQSGEIAVIGPRATVSRPPTVGREEQRTQLRRAFARVKDGRGVIVAVTGEPGIGKTSLIEDFLAELDQRGERAILARGRCSESLAGADAYLPILESIESLLRRAAGASLENIIKMVAPTWHSQVATQSSDAGLASETREAPPPVSQERLKRELGALLHEISRLQPLIVFIDDLHWADVSTIDLLNYLAGRFADMRVMVLTSYRPSDMALVRHPFLAIRNDLQARGVFEEVSLRFLDAGDVERYLELQFPNHRLPRDFAALIHAKTEGSPLFLADLVRYLRDTGGIIEQDGHWILARSLPDVPRDLPESVRAMITRKIEQVSEFDRRLLLAASVHGQEFDTAIVSEALGIDAADVEERLESLERVHVFVKRGDELEFPDKTLTLKYQFVHVLYQNVLFASLQPTRRIALSGSIARALVAHYQQDTSAIAGRLAVLFETAREFASSAQYFYAAAQRDVSLFAFREALSLAERGLDGLRALAEGRERHQLELGLQMIRGLALRSVKGWAAPELEAAFARARQLCQELQNPPELFPALWNLTFFYMIRGDLATVRDASTMLMQQAERSPDPAYRMAVDHLLGVSAEFMGDFVESNRLLEHARQLHVPGEHQAYTAMFGIDPGMVARAMSSRPLWALGYPDQAIARSRETIALGRSQRQPVSFVFALIVAQGIHLYRGEAADAFALGDEIIALCREYEFPQEAEWARGFQGAAMALQGRAGDGAAQLCDSLTALQSLGSGLTRTMFLALHADALLRADQIDEGLHAVDEGFAHAERTLERGFVAELHRLRGELLRAAGNDAGAEDSLRAALRHARQQHARSFELRAATALARLQIDSGKPMDAWAELAAVHDWFTEGHGTADLIAARTTLSEIGR